MAVQINGKVRGDEVKIVLDKTPFYAESGGQVGDTGILKTSAGAVKILDTKKRDDIYFHSAKVIKGNLSVNDTVRSQIDVDRRLSIMRNHTATHLLQSALREVLGSHIQQQGSLVDENRLRFDFTHPKAISKEELGKIEDLVNTFIRACNEVVKEVMPIERAKETGALAYFAEKYGSTVRVVSIGSYSKEFCGGTHLGATGQIGVFKIISETAIAQGIRRIEAQTGIGALRTLKEKELQLDETASILKVTPQEVAGRVQQLSDNIKELERAMESVRLEAIKKDIDKTIDAMAVKNGVNIISQIYNNFEIETLRKVSEYIKQKVQSSIIILGAKSDKNASIFHAQFRIQHGIKLVKHSKYEK
jgi:alanyl-tRNA synthetase